MSIQLMWKRSIPQSSTCVSIPILLVRQNEKPKIKITKFCTETKNPSQTPPDNDVITYFFINKCVMTEKDVSKIFIKKKIIVAKQLSPCLRDSYNVLFNAW